MTATSFASLKKNRKGSLEKLSEEANKLKSGGGGFKEDDRYWKPTVDAAGNGSAVIRFLPAAPGEDVPFVRYWDHGFKGPGGWYIEKSLTSINKEDPVGEYNSKLWNTGNEADKEIARKQKRRLHYVSNIYVINDQANPSNNGKVFLFEYGKKIFDKINDAMHPEFDDIEAVNPFDFWEGANFRLRIRQVDGFRNYDKSEFDSPGALKDDDDELEKIWSEEHKLDDVLDPKNYKSYEELEARLKKVLGSLTPTTTAADDEDPLWTPPKEGKTAEQKSQPSVDETSNDEDDEDLAFFKNLVDD